MQNCVARPWAWWKSVQILIVKVINKLNSIFRAQLKMRRGRTFPCAPVSTFDRSSVGMPFHVTSVSARLTNTWSRAPFCSSPMPSICMEMVSNTIESASTSGHSSIVLTVAFTWTLRCASWRSLISMPATFLLSCLLRCSAHDIPVVYPPTATTGGSLCWAKSLCGVPTSTTSASLVRRLSAESMNCGGWWRWRSIALKLSDNSLCRLESSGDVHCLVQTAKTVSPLQ